MSSNSKRVVALPRLRRVSEKVSRERVIVDVASASERLNPPDVDPQVVLGAGICKQLRDIRLSDAAVGRLALLVYYVKRLPAAELSEPSPRPLKEANSKVIKALQLLSSAIQESREALNSLSHAEQVGLGIGLDALGDSATRRNSELERDLEVRPRAKKKKLPFKVYLTRYVANQLHGEPVAITRGKNVDGTKQAFELVCELVFGACALGPAAEASIREYLDLQDRATASKVKRPSAITKFAAPSMDELSRVWHSTAPLRN